MSPQNTMAGGFGDPAPVPGDGVQDFPAPITVAGAITSSIPGIAATYVAGVVVANPTAATVGTQAQHSGAVQWTGSGWKTNAVAGPMTIDIAAQLEPVAGTSEPSSYFQFKRRVNGGAWTNFLSIFDGAQFGITTCTLTGAGSGYYTARGSSTGGFGAFEAMNDGFFAVTARIYGSAAASGTTLSTGARANSVAIFTDGERLDIFTTAAKEVWIGTNAAVRTKWSSTGTMTHTATMAVVSGTPTYAATSMLNILTQSGDATLLVRGAGNSFINLVSADVNGNHSAAVQLRNSGTLFGVAVSGAMAAFIGTFDIMYGCSGAGTLYFATSSAVKAQIDTDATANQMPLLVKVGSEALRRFKVGGNGSGPAGVGRAVYVDNA